MIGRDVSGADSALCRQQAFPTADWDSLILRDVVPGLGALLRDKLVINPREQDMKPFESALAWVPLLRSSMTSQLLETGFFPKWLDALYTWLCSEGVNLEQVADWYVGLQTLPAMSIR